MIEAQPCASMSYSCKVLCCDRSSAIDSKYSNCLLTYEARVTSNLGEGHGPKGSAKHP